MNGVLVQYKVKADRVAENEEKVRAVYRELAERADPAIHYTTFKLDDGQTFAHLALWADDASDAGLGSIEAFKAFQENIADRWRCRRARRRSIWWGTGTCCRRASSRGGSDRVISPRGLDVPRPYGVGAFAYSSSASRCSR